MVLDIGLFRADKGGNPDLIRESQQRRGKSVEVVQQVIEVDSQHRASKWDSLFLLSC